MNELIEKLNAVEHALLAEMFWLKPSELREFAKTNQIDHLTFCSTPSRITGEMILACSGLTTGNLTPDELMNYQSLDGIGKLHELERLFDKGKQNIVPVLEAVNAAKKISGACQFLYAEFRRLKYRWLEVIRHQQAIEILTSNVDEIAPYDHIRRPPNPMFN